MVSEPNALRMQALGQLLERSRLTSSMLAAYLEKAVDIVYWRTLNPTLSLDGGAGNDTFASEAIELQRCEELARHVATEGYFRTEPILPKSVCARMRACVEAIQRERWPLVFSFLYDEFWLVSRSASLTRLFTTILGQGYKQLPHIWTHYVSAHGPATGWPPHFDGFGKPNRLTIWIPLTDATVDNSCIYVVPKYAVPARIIDLHGRIDTVNWIDVKSILQASQAMPAAAGSVLGWTYDVLHWGSACADSSQPRISISMELIGGAESPRDDELPLLPPNSNAPSFHQKLAFVAKAILAYREFEPLLIRYFDLAQQLLEYCRAKTTLTVQKDAR